MLAFGGGEGVSIFSYFFPTFFLNLGGNRQRHRTAVSGLKDPITTHCMPSGHVLASLIPEKCFPSLSSSEQQGQNFATAQRYQKLSFLCKALSYNNTTYKSTMMIPIRSDSKSMPINSRTLNRCCKTPVTTVFILTFPTKTKSKLKTNVIKKK